MYLCSTLQLIIKLNINDINFCKCLIFKTLVTTILSRLSPGSPGKGTSGGFRIKKKISTPMDGPH